MLHRHQRLGDFQIIRFLGKGGMSEVYEAQQHNPVRRVALKVLAASLAAHPDVVQRFEREAEALARLDHPGIVRILTTGRTPDGTFYFTMQLIRGATLNQVIRAVARTSPMRTVLHSTISDEPGVPTSPEEMASRVTTLRADGPPPDLPEKVLRRFRDDRFGFVRDVGLQVARALDAAHREGVLHRDLKPGNLMIDHDGHVYLTDFGLARLLDGGEGTQSGVVKGTPWYMSPEQARGEPLDVRSDLYSLGVTLYELATGGLGPFDVERSDRDAVIAAVRRGDVIPLRFLVPAVPDDIDRVVTTAMRPRPEERFPTAAALLAGLESPSPVAAPHSEPSTQVRPPLPARLWLLPGGVLLAAAVVAAAALAFRPPEPTPDVPPTFPAPPETSVFPWPDHPQPPSRLHRTFGVPLALFKKPQPEPVWCRTLKGDPNAMTALPNNALALTGTSDWPTLVLLDYDFDHNWYRYDVKIQAFPLPGRIDAQVGLIFGYRRNALDPSRHHPMLMLVLDERPSDGGNPRVLVGSGYVEESYRGRNPTFRAFRTFDHPWGRLDLAPPPRAAEGWRSVQVRAVDDRVTVVVDEGKPLELDLAQVRAGDKARLLEGLDARGGVGIWAHHALGWFADATVTPLPTERPPPRNPNP